MSVRSPSPPEEERTAEALCEESRENSLFQKEGRDGGSSFKI